MAEIKMSEPKAKARQAPTTLPAPDIAGAEERRATVGLKFFVDTADLEEIRQGLAMGLVDGVTTNPSLIAKALGPGRGSEEEIREHLIQVASLVPGPVSAEVVSIEAEGMITEGRRLARLAPNIVVKIPTILEGLKAIRVLSGEGIRINSTLVFSSLQALIVAKAGASFVSPFVGRLDDVGHSGMEIVEEIRTIYDQYGITTEILVASCRHPLHVKQAALLGTDIATMPFSVLTQLVKHPLTDVGLKRFLEDWRRMEEQAR